MCSTFKIRQRRFEIRLADFYFKKEYITRFSEKEETVSFIEAIKSKEIQLPDNQATAITHLPDYQVVKIVKGKTNSFGKKKHDQVWLSKAYIVK